MLQTRLLLEISMVSPRSCCGSIVLVTPITIESKIPVLSVRLCLLVWFDSTVAVLCVFKSIVKSTIRGRGECTRRAWRSFLNSAVDTSPACTPHAVGLS